MRQCQWWGVEASALTHSAFCLSRQLSPKARTLQAGQQCLLEKLAMCEAGHATLA